MAARLLVSYIVLAVAAVVLAVFLCADPAEGLTAFGKSPSNDKGDRNSSKPSRKPQKTCTNNDECRVRATLCKLIESEGRKHCVCPDNSAPDNGMCKQKGSAPGKICAESSQCSENAECFKNGTKKVCMCLEGYTEINHQGYIYCNGFERLLPSSTSILLTIAIFGFLRTLLLFP